MYQYIFMLYKKWIWRYRYVDIWIWIHWRSKPKYHQRCVRNIYRPPFSACLQLLKNCSWPGQSNLFITCKNQLAPINYTSTKSYEYIFDHILLCSKIYPAKQKFGPQDSMTIGQNKVSASYLGISQGWEEGRGQVGKRGWPHWPVGKRANPIHCIILTTIAKTITTRMSPDKTWKMWKHIKTCENMWK